MTVNLTDPFPGMILLGSPPYQHRTARGNDYLLPRKAIGVAYGLTSKPLNTREAATWRPITTLIRRVGTMILLAGKVYSPSPLTWSIAHWLSSSASSTLPH